MIDLTLPIKTGMPTFPSHGPFKAVRSVAPDTGATSHRIEFSTHQGTHLDAPDHFVDGGKTVDEIDLEQLVGYCRIADLRDWAGEPINANILSSVLPDIGIGDSIVLITGDVDAHFESPDFFSIASSLTVDAAEWIVDHEVSLIYNDFLTESLDNNERPVHNTILEAEIPIIEYVCNTETIVNRKEMEIACYPLRLEGFEAAPVRVIAVD